MTISAEFIDQIVRNVMREMQSRVPTIDAARSVARQPAIKAESLQIGSRVVSEHVLAAANAAGRVISLTTGAVITPSGRDYIRKNAVRLANASGEKNSTSVSGTFITVGENANASAALAAGWKTIGATTEFDAAALAVEHRSTGIVTSFGGEPSVVACLLNRDPSMRAAVVTRGTNLITLTAVMEPQVVCLQSTGWSFGELLRLLRGLAAATAVPKGWKELPGGTP